MEKDRIEIETTEDKIKRLVVKHHFSDWLIVMNMAVELTKGRRTDDPVGDTLKAYNAMMTEIIKPLLGKAERVKAEEEAA